MFDALLKAGDDPREVTIYECIQNGRPDMARRLLAAGMDPNEIRFSGENRGNVYWAVYYNQPEILKMLLDRGADPTQKDNYGETPLKMAQQSNRKDMVAMLQDAIKRRPPAQ